MQKNFRTYQRAKELYHNSSKLILKGEVKDQLKRASLSVVLNLAEGSGRTSAKDRKRFYSIALGSLQECACIFDLLEQEQRLNDCKILKFHLLKLIQNPGPDFR